MNSRLQEALRSGTETIESLTTRLFLKAKQHPQYPQLTMLKYDQINSPMSDPLVQEARGIIFDTADNFRIVSRPFDKFFNAGEGLAAKIDWSTARVQEKLDGSLVSLFWYDDHWIVASSGTPDAGGQVGAALITFKDLFWQVWNEKGYSEANLNRDYTYMFELCTKLNRIVVSHAENRLVLLGLRDRETGQEASPLLMQSRFEVVKHYAIRSEADLVKSFDDFDGLNQEGYVVCDHLFNRNKVKHPRYVLLHHMVGSLSAKKLLDTIRTGEMSEVLVHFPEWQAEADRISGLYAVLVTEAVMEYLKVQNIVVQKDFAIAIKDSRHRAAMFAVRAGKAVNFSGFYATLRIDALADMLGLKEAPETA